jgi:hypothetical protein
MAEGFTNADEALRSEMIRADLRKICRQHWKHDTPQPADPILTVSRASTRNP